MNYIPLIALCVSSVLSVAAIVISALSFRSSWRAQRHSQIVSFEQRRQEVRQILFEGQLMIGEINAEMNRGLINAETLPDPDIPILARETISRLDAITRQRREALKILEELPSSPIYASAPTVRGNRRNSNQNKYESAGGAQTGA
jgi:hypothetical protein